jgi:sigma-B regulation protein RsbU (phosphoserine phosphatase)
VPHHRTSLPPEALSVASARRVVEDMLLAHGLDAVVPDALLLTSELVTNAVQHAGTTVIVDVELSERMLRVAVGDGDVASLDDVEVRNVSGRVAPDGWGLALVQELALDWGRIPLRDGKIVWFMLQCPPESWAPSTQGPN